LLVHNNNDNTIAIETAITDNSKSRSHNANSRIHLLPGQ
jgi:hypothetical protein